MGKLLDFLTFKRDVAPAPVRLIGFPSDGGLVSSGVTSTTTLGLSAVWRSLDILSNGISTLQWNERRGNLDLPLSRLVSQPQAERTRREWVSLTVSTLALFDVCYLLKVGGVDSEGVPLGLWPLDPSIVQPLYTDYFTSLPPDEFFVNGHRISRDQLVILHRSPQPGIHDESAGVINLARRTFAAAIAAESYASRYWQAGGSPTTVLETEATLNAAQAQAMGDAWSQRKILGPDHAPVLSNGVHAKPFGADPTQESAVEARRELVADIGRYFGIPTAILNAPAGDSETYASVESQGMYLVQYTLKNYIAAIEDAISDLLPGGRKMRMDVTPLTRGTQLARAQAWQLALEAQWMTVDEVREAEGLPPMEPNAISLPQPIGVTAK